MGEMGKACPSLDPHAGGLEVGSPLKAPGPARSAWQQPSEGRGEGEAGRGRAHGLVLKHQEAPRAWRTVGFVPVAR